MSRPKVSVYIAMSLDGFIAGENHELDWLDEAADHGGEDYGFTPFFESVDTMLMGRRTYDVVRSLPHDWPYAKKRTIVLSSRPGRSLDGEEFRDEPLAELLEEIYRDGGRHVYADGGAVIRSMLTENLVDEMTISIMPVLLGAGIPLFGPGTPKKKLKPLSVEQFDSGVTIVKYGF